MRVFGLTTGFTTAVSIVGGFGVGVGTAAGAPVVLFVAGGVVVVDGATLEPAAVVLLEPGVLDVVGAAGSVVNGVGSGGNGFDMTAAMRSVRPASKPL